MKCTVFGQEAWERRTDRRNITALFSAPTVGRGHNKQFITWFNSKCGTPVAPYRRKITVTNTEPGTGSTCKIIKLSYL